MAKTGTLVHHPDDSRLAPCGEAEVVEARLMASQWQSLAEDAERRVAELERQLASSTATTLDLRSRLVCLHGKLATSTATARYQVLALALEHQPAHTAVNRMPAHGRTRV